MSLHVGNQMRAQHLTSAKSTSHAEGARAASGDQARASGSDSTAKGDKSNFCCGKGCCSGGRSRSAQGSLNMDPMRLALEMQRRAQETSAATAA